MSLSHFDSWREGLEAKVGSNVAAGMIRRGALLLRPVIRHPWSPFSWCPVSPRPHPPLRLGLELPGTPGTDPGTLLRRLRPFRGRVVQPQQPRRNLRAASRAAWWRSTNSPAHCKRPRSAEFSPCYPPPFLGGPTPLLCRLSGSFLTSRAVALLSLRFCSSSGGQPGRERTHREEGATHVVLPLAASPATLMSLAPLSSSLLAVS